VRKKSKLSQFVEAKKPFFVKSHYFCEMSQTFEIAVFASGEGSNFESIVHYFAPKTGYSFTLYGHKNHCGAYLRAERLGVPVVKFDPSELSERVPLELSQRQTQLVVLAGFILLLPACIHEKYPTLNIHPSLLPKYGGKGMYGKKVLKQILDNEEEYAGITIHLVNHEYDKGDILLQSAFRFDHRTESLESLMEKVHQLEHASYPKFIESFIKTRLYAGKS
jgi:phosphoribosylglycinamide formyltransferase-1